MDIESLIKQASEQSPVFRKKWGYWVVQRKKAPTFDWLMENLEDALGRDYVREQAKRHIEDTKTSKES